MLLHVHVGGYVKKIEKFYLHVHVLSMKIGMVENHGE